MADYLELVPLEDVMDVMEEEEEEFKPRPYQTYLLQLARAQNTILFLPTGSGKTYVAIMLIKELSHSIRRSHRHGGKRTFFLVNTVALVTQQGDSIRKHTPFSVGGYSGDQNVDEWEKDRWNTEFEEHQIIVMTAQIFLNILLQGFFQLSLVNLLIFDECHHAVKDHAMRQIMRLFEKVPDSQQPRVLGLSATLILGTCKLENVPKEVEMLEKTFHSKVATINNMQVVKKFSTNPTETTEPFSVNKLNSACKEVIDEINDYLNDLAYIEWPKKIIESPPGKQPLYPKDKIGKTLKNLLGDLQLHVEMLGVYGGSKSCLVHLIQLERIRIRAEEDLVARVYSTLISGVTIMYQRLLGEMEGEQNELDKIMKYSTDKMLTLFRIISQQKCKEKFDENGEPVNRFCGVVFVQRRFTAKTVYQILLSLAEAAPEDYGFIQPDFIVGLNANPMNDTREGKLEQKTNNAVLYRFNKGFTNLLVSSDVLEEGIDIPALSLVVRFDAISNPSSYIQSKGRARHKTSNFKMMVPYDERTKFNEKFISYQQVERKLISYLVGQNESRRAPTMAEINAAMHNEQFPPYYTTDAVGEGSPCITIGSAVSLLHRYCSMLPQDKFTSLQPKWYIDVKTGVIYVQLPMSSPLRGLIGGGSKLSKRDAKRTAAMEACKRLHKLGELNEQLLPKGAVTEYLDDDFLFPNWDNEEPKDELGMVGTQKKLRQFKKHFPAALSKSIPEANSVTYLHRITLVPTYQKPTKNRRAVFYDLLNSDCSYAIISSAKMPQVCEFSIFLNVGEVAVSIEVNAEELQLTEMQIKLLRDFNAMLFNEVLGLEKGFLINDISNTENAFLIVPTSKESIDWDVVTTHKTVPRVTQPSVDVQREMEFDDRYHLAVISPWYRCSSQIQPYVVTRVCYDLDPTSPFPTEDFQSFEEYYEKKYSVHTYNHSQPLVEVKAISNKMHCLKPRIAAVSKTRSKRRQQDINEDFEEHLVPELCVRFDFPAVLWLKATCLPTVLHRLTQLLLAEELRVAIAKELSLGVETLPPATKWNRLAVDANCESPETQPETLLGVTTASVAKQLQPDQLWGEELEPVDIDRRPLEQVFLAEIQNFERFIQMKLPSSPAKRVESDKEVEDIPVRKIKILGKTADGIGPQQSEIIQALTSGSANDIVNLERSELLGDSFLKFAVSLYLYQNFAKVDEGKLTTIKGKLVGNRNLFYCGKSKGLPGKMKVNDFSPSSDFIPPSMCVPKFVREVFIAADLSPNTLLAITIPREERLNGTIGRATIESIQDQMLDATEEIKTNSAMETFLGLQTVKDKTVADSVEALIGTYLKECGVRGALSLLGWLQVLPASEASPEKLLDQEPPSALLQIGGDVLFHLKASDRLERDLGYTFQDKSFLLQALTHPSYESNRITESYQRLEFLGDSLIDFLITSHIFERCGSMSPGQLTDLRSALVNNIYFASVVVRNGFHKHMHSSSPKLHDLITTFVTLQEERNHVINEQVLFLIEESDTHPDVAECIDVPKALGDLLEALIGAVYLDSNMSLETVWGVLYKLIHNEIDEFIRNLPKQPVRLLYERLGNNRPIFHPSVVEADMVTIKLEIVVDGVRKFYMGIGNNKTLAKTAAAKIAIKGLGMQA